MTLRRFLPLLLFLLLLMQGSFAQNDNKPFRGLVLDSLTKTPLEACTVILLQGKTSQKSSTNDRGFFSFETKTDTVLFLFQHTGYRDKQRRLIAAKTDTVLLAPADKLMESVVVKAKRAPIVVHGDTTDFNIDSSMFEPFDVVEDLIKRLPGLEQTEEGLKFRGKPIERILVDGEPLFDETGTFALKKLPAGMVAKIQVMDTKTLEQLFNGTPPGGERKTLNIQLRAGNKYFGSLQGGAGTRNQLDAGATGSRFREAERLSLTGAYTASNKSGVFKNTPGPSTEVSNAGINYGNKWGRLRFNGSHGFNQSQNSSESRYERTQILTADTSFFTRSINRFDGTSAAHRLNLSANVWLDSASLLDLSLGYTHTENNNRNSTSSLTAEAGALRNESRRSTINTGTSDNWNAAVSWRRWLNRKGRSLSVNARAGGGENRSTILSQANNSYFKSGVAVNGDTLDRRTLSCGDNRSYALNLSYTEPLSKTLRLLLVANLDAVRSTSNREQYNVDSLTQNEVFDTAFSAQIFTSAQTQTLSAQLVQTGKKLYVSAGLSTVWQQADRRLQKGSLTQHLLRHSPALNLNYKLSENQNLRVNFSAATVQPTAEQLQPVPDNSNPLYVRTGNPDLRTSFSQNYALSYDQNKAGGNLSLALSYSPVSNQIVNAVTYDAFRRVVSQYVNVDGTFAARANLYGSRLLRKGDAVTSLTAASGVTLNRQVYFQSGGRYGLRNESANLSLSVSKTGQAVRSPGYGLSVTASQSRSYTPEDLGVMNTSRWNLAPAVDASFQVEKLYATFVYQLAYNRLNYHSARRRDDEFVVHGATANLRIPLWKAGYLQANTSYQYNTQVPEGAVRGQFNSTLSATAQLWKNRGRAVLTVYDLFATANSLRRTAGENYIEDYQSPVLRNYVALKLQYNFSKLQKKEQATGTAN